MFTMTSAKAHRLVVTTMLKEPARGFARTHAVDPGRRFCPHVDRVLRPASQTLTFTSCPLLCSKAWVSETPPLGAKQLASC